MNLKKQLGLVVLVIAVVALFKLGPWRRQPVDKALTKREKQLSPGQPQAAPVVPGPVTSAIQGVPRGQSSDSLLKLCAAVTDAPDAAAGRRRLSELRQAFSAMPTNAAVSAIRQMLDSKTDNPTHLGFKVAANGLLDEAPTLRTFLLDELGRLDPAAAAEYAKVILASKDSPDEWAVALRDLARGDQTATGRDLLEQKTRELLREESWQANPSVGYLEAFDAAVYLGGTNLMPVLSDLVRRQDNPAVAHAAYLALDRLVINDPSLTLSVLQSSPELMQGRELTRANYFARADVRDPQQRQLLESYLLNPQIGSMELDAFAGLYPSANYMISRNLLTPTPTPDHAALVSRDAESLRVLEQWQNDPRFANLSQQLSKARLRLEEFVRQAGGK